MPYKPNQYPEYQQRANGDQSNGTAGSLTSPSMMNAAVQSPGAKSTGGGFDAYMNSANAWTERLKPMRAPRQAQPPQPAQPQPSRRGPAPYNPNDPLTGLFGPLRGRPSAPGASYPQPPGGVTPPTYPPQPPGGRTPPTYPPPSPVGGYPPPSGGNPPPTIPGGRPRPVGAPDLPLTMYGQPPGAPTVDWSRLTGSPLQEQTKPYTGVSPLSGMQGVTKPYILPSPPFTPKSAQNNDPVDTPGSNDPGTQPPGNDGPVNSPNPGPGSGGTSGGGGTPPPPPPPPPPSRRRPSTQPPAPDPQPPPTGPEKPTLPDGTATPPPFTLGQAPHPFDLPGTPQGDQSYMQEIENLIRGNYQTGRNEGLRQLKHEAGLVGAQSGGGYLDSVGDFMAKSLADENAAVADKGFTGLQSARDRALADAQARMGLYGSIYGTERGAETSIAGTNQQQQQGVMGYNADLARIAAQMYGIDINDRQAMMRLMWEMDPRNWMSNYVGAQPPGYGYVPPGG